MPIPEGLISALLYEVLDPITHIIELGIFLLLLHMIIHLTPRDYIRGAGHESEHVQPNLALLALLLQLEHLVC